MQAAGLWMVYIGLEASPFPRSLVTKRSQQVDIDGPSQDPAR